MDKNTGKEYVLKQNMPFVLSSRAEYLKEKLIPIYMAATAKCFISDLFVPEMESMSNLHTLHDLSTSL